MKIINNFTDEVYSQKPSIMLIGYFDSVHLGHTKIIKEMIDISRDKNLNHYLLTFKNLPSKTKKFKNILEPEDKVSIIKNLGVKNLILVEFDEKIANMSPKLFLEVVKNNFNVTDFIVGEDFKFGNGRTGSVLDLEKMNFNIHLSEKLIKNGIKISTKIIKNYISEGNIEAANSLIGRNYYIKGIVRRGKQIGRKIGFPTMNIINNDILLPQTGAYVTKTIVDSKEYYSMTYASEEMVETNLIDYDKYHYNFKIKIDFFKKIRDNMAFSSVEKLKNQLEDDLEYINGYFKN
ncbi:MAG TPA: riboflavin biosynthesis protein RibF [Spirochaetota bacterium]|nr:riboflavin biosynthesis protein RibF [Spirochaetota bacterium]